jgi:hypothetical protein
MKRIHNVTIQHMHDESPDTSYLGDYSDSRTSEFSIDRKHSEDCQINHEPKDTIDQLERAISYLQKQDKNNGTDFNYNNDAIDELITLQDMLAECSCDESGDMQRGQYRYFNPSFNYVDKNGKPSEGNAPEEIRKYVRQDYARMERLNAGDWYYIGIRAKAEILIPDGTLSGQVYITQTITSGGLWGTESDSDKSHLESIAKEELAALRTQLTALGFSKRAISSAFKNLEVSE